MKNDSILEAEQGTDSTERDKAEAFGRVVVRIRPDLQWRSHRSGKAIRWIARDPVSQDFYYFSQRERDIIWRLDGSISLKQLLFQYQNEYSSSALSLDQLANFVSRLESANLLLSNRMGDGIRLHRNRLKSRKRSFLASCLSPLAVRVPLIDPTPVLSRLDGLARLLFHPFLLLMLCILVFAVGLFSLVQWSQLEGSLPTWTQVLQGDRVLGMLVCYALVKSLHEFGHALACRRFGAECHEIGLMFLVFAPCLYCDVSDVWRVSNRWQRASVAAAGIYIELFVATLAAILWMMSSEGWVHLISFNLMVVCSVSTVMINANPLLRYDGYYILSDIWGVPNLAEQSQEVINRSFAEWLTGDRSAADVWDSNRWALGVYGVASTIYRWLVMLVILWGIHNVMQPLGLSWIAVVLAGLLIFGALSSTYRQMRQIANYVKLGSPIIMTRMLLVLGGLTGLVWLVAVVSWPESVRCRAVAKYAVSEPLFARLTASVVESVPANTSVMAGQSLLVLSSPERELELLNLRGEMDQLRERAKQVEMRRVTDPAANFELPPLLQSLEERSLRAKLLEEDLKDLVILAPYAGILIEATRAGQGASNGMDEIWNFRPLSAENRSCVVDRGTLLGWVCQPDTWRIEAYVSERQVEKIRIGAAVRCRLDNALGDIVLGKVEYISPDPIQTTPPELWKDYAFVSVQGLSGGLKPENPHYAITIRVDNYPSTVLHGALATVRVQTEPTTLVERIWRATKQSFKLDLGRP